MCVKKYNFKISALVGFIVRIGNRLVNFTCSKKFSISRTYFPHKRIHKQTWQSPDGKRVNQIDHVLIDRRHGTDMQCMRGLRGADCYMDPNMVHIKYKLQISNECKKRGNYKLKKFNTIILKTKKNERRYNGKFT